MAHSLRTTIGSTIGPNPLSCLESWWNFKASLAAIYSNHDKSLCRNLTTFYLLPPHHTKAKRWSHSGFLLRLWFFFGSPHSLFLSTYLSLFLISAFNMNVDEMFQSYFSFSLVQCWFFFNRSYTISYSADNNNSHLPIALIFVLEKFWFLKE